RRDAACCPRQSPLDARSSVVEHLNRGARPVTSSRAEATPSLRPDARWLDSDAASDHDSGEPMATARPLAQTLGAPRSIQGIDFIAGTQLFFGLPNELIASMLPEDQVIAGIPCARGLVHFHPGGQVM